MEEELLKESSETNFAAKKKAPQPVRAGLSKRLLAGILDSIVLGLVGSLLGVCFSSFFFMIGENGWWIGAIISIGYFSILQSKIGKGASVGYRIMKLQVVGIDGTYLAIQQSLVRATLLCLTYFGLDILRLFPLISVPSLIISDILNAYLIATLIFVVFHPLHRGPYDLLSRGVVVNKKPYELLTTEDKQSFLNQPVSIKKLQIVSGILILLMIIGTTVSYIFFGNASSLTNLLTLQKSINQIPGITVSSFSDVTYYTGDHSKSLNLEVLVDRANYENHTKLISLAQQIENTALTEYPGIKEDTYINLTMTSGFDIGITEFHESLTDEESVSDLLQGKSDLASTTPN